jgi:ketosteroid isomerase-like protein
MSQENVERTRRLLELSTKDEYEAALELLHDDVSGYPLVSAVEGGYHGHDGIRAWWENLRDSFLDYVIDVQDMRSLSDDLVLAQLWFHGRGTASNTPFELHVWYLVEWRDGKAVSLHAYAAEAEALAAASA